MATTPPKEPTRKEFEARIADLDKKLAAAEKALSTERAAHQAALKKADASHAAEIARLNKAHEARLTAEQAAQRKREDAQAAQINKLNLERLGLEDRLIKLGAELDKLRTQVKAASTRLTSAATLEDSVTQLTAELRAARAQNDQFLAENRRLADALDVASADTAVFRDHAASAQTRLTEGLAVERERLRGEFEGQLAAVSARARLAESQAASLGAQLAGNGRLAVIAPDQIGELTSRFIGQIEQSLPGLRLSQGELKLKLGLAQTAGQTGFVVVGPGAPSTLKDQLHDFSLKFDRAVLGGDARLAVVPAEPVKIEPQ